MPGYCYNTQIVYGGVVQPTSSITLQQRKVNEKWIENKLLKSKRWVWKDEMMIYTQDGNKITCNREAYNKLALIVNNKWLNKNVKIV
tara:strand:- start:185 stop:445 length:261 start_codon:yes stop_codon:yes gene_type:complete